MGSWQLQRKLLASFLPCVPWTRLLQKPVKSREEQEKPSIESYAASLRILAICSERQIFADMMSIPKGLVRGLNALISHQDFVNDQ